ncbi:putative secreted protein (Por secretion system target) [Chitinophaga dinghuensis]|uniref:Putative secreted protein (Por secretion system target) n=1 Tax=Chitinophaga dinghuensis TaxID=1539050 RepID=A0A327W613_9BACT|nr:putative secreted protein (Por secretion system target) [Chitinophaga dinghuensis]
MNVTLKSNATCAIPATVSSDTVLVNTKTYPGIATITPDATSTCYGVPVTFTAKIPNPDKVYNYTWIKNNKEMANGSYMNTYTDAQLTSKDSVWLSAIQYNECGYTTYISNKVNIKVDTIKPEATLTPDNAEGCIGQKVKVHLTWAGINQMPVRVEWTVNNVVTITNDTVREVTVGAGITFVRAKAVWLLPCGYVESLKGISLFELDYNTNFDITADRDIICPGQLVTFTATPQSPAQGQTFEWAKNGRYLGIFGSTYKDSTLADNDYISCRMKMVTPCGKTVVNDTRHGITVNYFRYSAPTIYIKYTVLAGNQPRYWISAILGNVVNYSFDWEETLNGKDWKKINQPTNTFNFIYEPPAKVSGIRCILNTITPCSTPYQTISNEIRLLGRDTSSTIPPITPIDTSNIPWADTTQGNIIGFPNPVTNLLTVLLKSSDNWQRLSLKDRNGFEVYAQSVMNQTRINIPVEQLPSGIYFIVLYKESGYTETRRIVKQ